jgi:spore coat protein U-like protein
MDVRLRLEPGCSFVTDGLDAGLLDFGRTGGSGDPAPLDGMAMARGSLAVIHIACSSSYTGPNAPLLTISRGLHAQGGQRYLLGPDHERIAYDLYADPARRIPLDPSMPRQVAIPVAGVMAEVPIYGRIPRIGDPAAGLYTDVVWLTLSY